KAPSVSKTACNYGEAGHSSAPISIYGPKWSRLQLGRATAGSDRAAKQSASRRQCKRRQGSDPVKALFHAIVHAAPVHDSCEAISALNKTERERCSACCLNTKIRQCSDLRHCRKAGFNSAAFRQLHFNGAQKSAKIRLPLKPKTKN